MPLRAPIRKESFANGEQAAPHPGSGWCLSYRPLGFRGKLPGPALVGLAPAQAVKSRAVSPNSSRPTKCSNLWKSIHAIFARWTGINEIGKPGGKALRNGGRWRQRKIIVARALWPPGPRRAVWPGRQSNLQSPGSSRPPGRKPPAPR